MPHTPGPWSLEYLDRECTVPFAIVAGPNDVILTTEDGKGSSRLMAHDDDLALILQAPELLALKTKLLEENMVLRAENATLRNRIIAMQQGFQNSSP
jgi:hypothetical protein